MHGQLHFDEVKSQALATLQPRLKENDRVVVVRDVFGRISCYFVGGDRLSPEMANDVRHALEAGIGVSWVRTVEYVAETNPLAAGLREVAENGETYSEQLTWVERHLSLLPWETSRQAKVPDPKEPILPTGKPQVVTFYSFKGGMGRTTSLVATALTLARRGKTVVLVDFDLDAPGLAGLLKEELAGDTPGVVDYLLESTVYGTPPEVSSFCVTVENPELVGTEGGRIVIVPAGRSVGHDMSAYYEKLSRLDFNSPQFVEGKQVKQLLGGLSESYAPDFIFLDARTGLASVGGLVLTKMADLAVVVLYGTKQNMDGLKLVLPRLQDAKVPFILLNSPVPAGAAGEEEKDYFIAETYRIFSESYYQETEIPDISDETADHYPVNVVYRTEAALLTSIQRFVEYLRAVGSDGPYDYLASELEARLPRSTRVPDLKVTFHEEHLQAIEGIVGEVAAAEKEFSSADSLRQRFYPRKDHRFIFEPSRFLVIGPKGSGKSALFSVLAQNDYAKALAAFAGVTDRDVQNTRWIVGYQRSADFPSKENFRSVSSSSPGVIRSYWLCLAVRSIGLRLSISSSDEVIHRVVDSPLHHLLALAQQAGTAEACESFLSILDGELTQTQQRINLIYDDLDWLPEEEGAREPLLAQLIDLWSEFTGRYRRLGAKIFLRSDIFDREVFVTDKVKLRAHMANLEWQYDQLLNLVWKRIAENSAELQSAFQTALSQEGITFGYHDTVLGWVPRLDADGNKVLLRMLVGDKMGKGNKGYSYNWIQSRLSDTRGNITPRSILKLFSLAAQRERLDRRDAQPASSSIVRPVQFERVMPDVSEDRVDDLREEYPALGGLLAKLKYHLPRFPVSETDLLDGLRECGAEPGFIPLVVTRLEDVGVVKPYQRKRTDPVRFHIPDIYRIGLGLTRVGPK